MKTCDELLKQWNKCTGEGQILLDHSHPLRMFLNINALGNRELLIPVEKNENRFESTYAIGVENYQNKDIRFFAIELLRPELEKEYLSLCFDLVESSRECRTEKDARSVVFQTFKKWYALLSKRPLEILPVNEIKGLIGEIQYIVDRIKGGLDDWVVIDAWKIHKDASRDFVFDENWAEIKTIESSKNYITISSLDQLDNDIVGRLVIYRLNMSSDSGSFDLNEKVSELKTQIGPRAEAELNRKLLAKGYSYNDEYCKYRFLFDGRSDYKVDEQFPKIRRTDVSGEIINAKYDLDIGGIERWKIDG